jgi:hypothetical protein
MTTIAHFIGDPDLLGADFAGPSWDNWKITLKGACGEALTAREDDQFRALAGRAPPIRRVRELWLAIGRRAGKDSVASAIAAYLATFGDFARHLRRGERAVILCLAVDREQARIVYGYVRAYFEQVPLLAPLVQRITDDTVELNNGVDIVVATNSFRAIRGRTLAAAILDEIGYWRDDRSANPDAEVYAALVPGMATPRKAGAMLIGISTTYRRSGLLFSKWREHHGKDGDDVLVIRQPSIVYNPTLDEADIAADIERDPERGAAEWLSEWRSDLADFVDRAVVESLVEPGRFELPRLSSCSYVAFCDPSGGSSDSMTLAIAHAEKDGHGVLDAVREVRPPFSPEAVAVEFVGSITAYGLHSVTGDRYGAEWVAERFREHGVRYTSSERTKDQLYTELLDHPRLINQLCGLERRTARGGRDSIDHPSGAHDDVANAAAGALVLAAGRPDEFTRWQRAFGE